MYKGLLKYKKGLTIFKIAIVLMVFVVLAAFFSYVMLWAGFFASQKSQGVASNSIELYGDVIAKGDTKNTKIDNFTMFLQLTSGSSPIDMNKTVLIYSSPRVAPTDLLIGSTADASHFQIINRYNDATNSSVIYNGETFEILVNVSAIDNVQPNDVFQVEIEPPQKAPYTVSEKAPPSISTIMTLA